MTLADFNQTMARINAAIASAADDERRQRLTQLFAEVRQAREADEPFTIRDGGTLQVLDDHGQWQPVPGVRNIQLNIDGQPWADEPQPLVGAEHTIDVIDELYDTASEALEQRTAALGERAHAERKQRDRNRLSAAIRRWWSR